MMMLGLEVGLVAVVAHGYWFLFLSSFVSLHVASANVVVASDIHVGPMHSQYVLTAGI
jgi:hypothetical protein